VVDVQCIKSEGGCGCLVDCSPQLAQLVHVVDGRPVLQREPPAAARQDRGQTLRPKMVDQGDGESEWSQVGRGVGWRTVAGHHPSGERTSDPAGRGRPERDPSGRGRRLGSQRGRRPSRYEGESSGAAPAGQPGQRERQRRKQRIEIVAVAVGDIVDSPLRRLVEQDAGHPSAPPVGVLAAGPGFAAQHRRHGPGLGTHVDAAVAAKHRDRDAYTAVAMIEPRDGSADDGNVDPIA
jgi:hypothetical protein